MDGEYASPPAPAGSSHHLLPSELPLLLWAATFAAVAAWWVWPWVLERQRLKAAAAAAALAELSPAAPAAPSARAAARAAALAATAALEEEEARAPALDFVPELAFREVYDEAASLLGEALATPPGGAAFAEAMGALRNIEGVIDKIFKVWSEPEEGPRAARLREGGASFAKHFGPEGGPARRLLALAGFERQEPGASEGSEAVWHFRRDSPRGRLSALAVRLCLQKLSELQRIRGTMRWVQRDNASVVPKSGEGGLWELLELYRTVPVTGPSAPQPPSQRERRVEAEVRVKMAESRSAVGRTVPLSLHDGLTAVARRMAQAQRTQLRCGDLDADLLRPSDAYVRRAVSELPLPPGLHVAHLHWVSDELPRLFGLTSTTGKDGTAHGGRHGGESADAAADILAKEAVGLWAIQKADDLGWACAAAVGVGAALDYTVNRGILVALIVGYEGVSPDQDAQEARREQQQELRRRNQAKEPEAGAGPALPAFGARVHQLGNSSDAVVSQKTIHKK